MPKDHNRDRQGDKQAPHIKKNSFFGNYNKASYEQGQRGIVDIHHPQNHLMEQGYQIQAMLPEYITYKYENLKFRNIDFKAKNSKGDTALDRIQFKCHLFYDMGRGVIDPCENFRMNRGKESRPWKDIVGTSIEFVGKDQLDFKKKKELVENNGKQAFKKRAGNSRETTRVTPQGLKSTLLQIIESFKLKISSVKWIEDNEFLHHWVNKFGIFYLKKLQTDEDEKLLEREFRPVDDFAVEKLSLPTKGGNFLKNFFFNTFYKNSPLNMEATQGSSAEENLVKFKLEPFGKYYDAKEDPFFEEFTQLDKNEILQVIGNREFLAHVHKNWMKFTKAGLLSLIKKLRFDLKEIILSKYRSSFVYYLFKLDFSDLDKVYVLYNDFYSGKIEKETIEREEVDEPVRYRSYNELVAEVQRLCLREELIRDLIIPGYQKYFGNEVSHRVIQKMLKDDIMAHRIMSDGTYRAIDFSNWRLGFFDEYRGPEYELASKLMKRNGLSRHSFGRMRRKLLPSRLALLSYAIQHVSKNFSTSTNSIQMTKTITTLIDFSVIKVISKQEIREKQRGMIIQRQKLEDRQFFKRLQPLIGYMNHNPKRIFKKSHLNKSLTYLMNRMPNEQLVNFFLKICENIRELVSNQHCNYLVQEVLERFDLCLKGKRMANIDFKFITDRGIKRLIGAEEYYQRKVVVLILEYRKKIRDCYLDNFREMMTEKYTKFVICSLISSTDSHFFFGQDGKPKYKRYKTQEEFIECVIQKFVDLYFEG